jgi:hypothetical protein
MSEFVELGSSDEPEEPGFEGYAELNGKTEVWVSRRKRDHLRSDLGLETLLAQQLELTASGVQIAPRCDECGGEESDEPLRRGRGRVEVPGAEIGVLEYHRGSGRCEPEVGRDLLVGPSEWPDLEAGVHEVERVTREPAVEQVVLHECHVAEAFGLYQGARCLEQLAVDVGAGDGSLVPDPAAQDAEPTEAAAAEVERPSAAALAQAFEERLAGRSQTRDCSCRRSSSES